ncbi:hypothetical protein [Nocardia heshunensis]
MPSITGESGAAYTVEDDPVNSDGGQSVLYRCRDSAETARIYKKYNKPLTDLAAIGWVTDAARRGREVVPAAEAGPGLAATAESSVNWPIDVIRQGNTAVGVVLPMIPAEFLLPGGKPRSAEYLFIAATNPPGAAVRVGVLVRVCDLFAVLHDQRLVHGDISPKNLVWSDHGPHAYLIDCDGLRPFRSTAHRGVATPNWHDPRLAAGTIVAHDEYSDRYGLALLMYRGLFRNPGLPVVTAGNTMSATGIPDGTDPRLRALFDRVFTDATAADARPTPQEWRSALTAVFFSADGTAYRRRALDILDRHAERVAPTRSHRTAAATGATATVTTSPSTTRTVLAATVRAGQRVPTAHTVTAPTQSGPVRNTPIPTAPPPRNLSPTAVVLSVALGIVVLIVVMAVVVTGSHNTAATTPTSTRYQTSTTATTSAATSAAATQARAVSNLLDRSATSRGVVAQAVQDVLACRDVAAQAGAIGSAETSRKAQYDSAFDLDVSALPGGTGLKNDLLDALRNSYLADGSYASWAYSVPSSCRSAPQTADYGTANGYSAQATTAKRAFVAEWNPVAAAYGLPSRVEGDI